MKNAGSIFLDDLNVVAPDDSNVVGLYQMLLQFFETNTWHNLSTNGLNWLEDMNTVACTSSDSNIYGPLPERLVARFNVLQDVSSGRRGAREVLFHHVDEQVQGEGVFLE